jgi:hypothetical protein
MWNKLSQIEAWNTLAGEVARMNTRIAPLRASLPKFSAS